MKKLIPFTVCIIFIASIWGCSRPQTEVAKQAQSTVTVKGSVHELTLIPDAPPPFPEHEGKTEFMSYCGICHSLKYISMQPDFPVKTWDAEVTKMIVKYHAPIDSMNAKKILEYLVFIKGKK